MVQTRAIQFLPKSYQYLSHTKYFSSRIQSVQLQRRTQSQQYEIDATDMHTGGMPVRIIHQGYPDIHGEKILDKRRYLSENFDFLRTLTNLEPRGHHGMYGAIITEPDLPEANFAVLFTHNEGYSTMCGHATIALAKWAVDSGRFPETKVNIQCPCGLVEAKVQVDENGGTTTSSFKSVPAFVSHSNVPISIPNFGTVEVDIAYGGAFYAFLPATSLNLHLVQSPLDDLVKTADVVTKETQKQIKLTHPDHPDLAFLYGTILTDGKPGNSIVDNASKNLCIFAEKQIDRSPTGSGVTARVAIDYLKSNIQKNTKYYYRSITGDCFSGEAIETGISIPNISNKGMVVEIQGRSFYTGYSRFVHDCEDPLQYGFALK